MKKINVSYLNIYIIYTWITYLHIIKKNYFYVISLFTPKFY